MIAIEQRCGDYSGRSAFAGIGSADRGDARAGRSGAQLCDAIGGWVGPSSVPSARRTLAYMSILVASVSTCFDPVIGSVQGPRQRLLVSAGICLKGDRTSVATNWSTPGILRPGTHPYHHEKLGKCNRLRNLSAVLDDWNDLIPRQANNLIHVAAHARSASPDTCLHGNRQASVLRKVGQGQAPSVPQQY